MFIRDGTAPVETSAGSQWLLVGFTPAGFASDYTRENTAKVRNVPGEQVQDRLHVVVVVIFPDPTYLKIGTLKRASVYTLERKEKKTARTEPILEDKMCPAMDFFRNETGNMQTCLLRSRFCLVTLGRSVPWSCLQRSSPTVRK